jgi:hypothetical protein
MTKSKSQSQTMRGRGYISASEAARRAGVSPAAVHGWIEREQVKAVHVGRRCYVELVSLISYLGTDGADAMGFTNGGARAAGTR